MRSHAIYAMTLVLTGILSATSVAHSEETTPKTVAAVAEDLKSGKPVRIVAFGDSITGGILPYRWPSRLGRYAQGRFGKKRILAPRSRWFNAGISGHTSTQGLARIERDVLAKKPDLVVVMFGMNDVTRKNIDQFEKNLHEIVRRCRAAGAAVVLSTPNSVYENNPRPIARLAEYAEVVRKLAKEDNVPLADSYKAYEAIRKADPAAWCVLMSETIHPNMNGHKLFAEVMAETISGEPVSIADAQPPRDSLKFTLANLRSGKPITIVAPAPYDTLLPKLLKERFPKAQIKTVSWPMKNVSLAECEKWAAKVRGFKPTLVVFAIPPTVDAASDEEFIRKSMWSLAQCASFGKAAWDILPILPAVAGEIPSEKKRHHEVLALAVAKGCDYPIVERKDGDKRSAEQILGDWIDAAMGR